MNVRKRLELKFADHGLRGVCGFESDLSGIAATPDTSDFTSVKERIIDRQYAAEVSTSDAKDQRVEHGESAGWLAPVDLDAPRKKVREKPTTRRASNKGCLQMTLDGYLKLLDWTRRQVRRDNAGRFPAEFSPILKRRNEAGSGEEFPQTRSNGSWKSLDIAGSKFTASLPPPRQFAGVRISWPAIHRRIPGPHIANRSVVGWDRLRSQTCRERIS